MRVSFLLLCRGARNGADLRDNGVGFVGRAGQGEVVEGSQPAGLGWDWCGGGGGVCCCVENLLGGGEGLVVGEGIGGGWLLTSRTRMVTCLGGECVSCLVCFGYGGDGGVQAEGASVARTISARIAYRSTFWSILHSWGTDNQSDVLKIAEDQSAYFNDGVELVPRLEVECGLKVGL